MDAERGPQRDDSGHDSSHGDTGHGDTGDGDTGQGTRAQRQLARDEPDGAHVASAVTRAGPAPATPGRPGAPRTPEEVKQAAAKLAPDLYRTVTQGTVTVDHLAQAQRIAQRYPELKAESRVLKQLGKDRYAEQTGDPIRTEYWCAKEYGGVVLTDSGRLLSVLNSSRRDLVVMELMVKQLAHDVERVFVKRSPRERVESVDLLYSVATRVMSAADIAADPGREPAALEDALAVMRTEWSLARRRAYLLIQRQARFEYFFGVILGLGFALGLFALVGALAADLWSNQLAVPAFLAATMAGSVGALISVLQRMSPEEEPRAGRMRRELVLDYTAPRWQKIIIGSARPLVGGVFAAVVYFALLGGLLTMQGPTTTTQDTPATFAFFALLGFVAGFSERFATDILERAGAAASPAGQKLPQDATDDGLDAGLDTASAPGSPSA